MSMTLSAEGRRALEAREGVRLRAYQDTRGVWTIGVGHTGTDVRKGEILSPPEVEALLAKDVGTCEAAVNGTIRRPLTQTQFDAFVSFAFNIGVAGFVHSTAARYWNMGYSPRMVGEAMMLWNEPPEILARRRGEAAQFETPL